MYIQDQLNFTYHNGSIDKLFVTYIYCTCTLRLFLLCNDMFISIIVSYLQICGTLLMFLVVLCCNAFLD